MDASFDMAQAGGAILDALDTGIVILDDECRVGVWNAWMERASGWIAPTWPANPCGKRCRT